MQCDYGCGKEAKFQFNNGKWCCSKFTSQCTSWKNNQSKKIKNWWGNLDSTNKKIYLKKEVNQC